MTTVLWADWVGHWPAAWIAWSLLLFAAIMELVHFRLSHSAPHIARNRHIVGVRTTLVILGAAAPFILLGHLLEAKTFGLLLALAMMGVIALSPWLRDMILTVVIAYDKRLSQHEDPHHAGAFKIGEVEGVVDSYRLGRVVLQSSDGTLHALPASRWFQETVSVPGEGFGDAACDVEFVLENPIDLEKTKTLLRFLAMTSIYASPRHRPEVFWLGEENQVHRFRVKTFASRAQLRDHFLADVQERFRQWKLEAKHYDRESS